ncbi:AP-3 complex subunit beta-1 [Thelohanellus kitauei]|uniref:AP-3 complex subunit beta-1 n=1 Tax=Thelohanellus kitauei TaxID=669202 RepID=A0A0C2IS59_THEKT|nr:AP-3 complex subunit beta-1 [Thelohanellus kitauei]
MEMAVEIFQNLKTVTQTLFKKTEEIQELLCSKNPYDIRDGLSAIFENIGHGKDFSFYYQKVVNLVASSDLEIKRLVGVIISEYSHKCPDISLLCVSALQRGILNKNHLVRAFSLRVLLHLDSEMFYEIQHQAVVSTITNSSSYVRRISCLGISTLVRTNPDRDDIHTWSEMLRLFLDSESHVKFGMSLDRVWDCVDDYSMLFFAAFGSTS